MKFKHWPWFAASSLLIGSTVAIGTPASATESCQQMVPAVVTLFSGYEIGTGSIIQSDGTILTAYHVVKEAVAAPSKVKIYVKLANGHRYVGKAIATDTRNDLALVQIPVQESLATVRLANAVSTQAGQRVCALGSPSGRSGTVSQGTFQTLLSNGDLKSAVKLSYGNSGGPLFNTEGELIGVNKSIWLSARGENTGISYATSVTAVKQLLDQHHSLASGPSTPPAIAAVKQPTPAVPIGRAPNPSLPQPIAANSEGMGATLDANSLTVQRVEFGSAADMGGLQPGDRLIALNGTPVTTLQQLQQFLNRRPTTAILTIERNQQRTNLQVNF